ncbi:MAG: C10 family peptidase [Bacteroidaceae bacterium]|nr:C10 family peptidase [Bacteroidaceae bacterium]
MKKINLIVLLLLMVQVAVAQRLIRRSSRYYVEAQTLPEKVEPLLTDTWDQYAPYHNMCPIDSTGERCVVGCVATAMSQVMHYWQWPERGRGSHEYVDSLGCGETLSADFSAHTYAWDKMLDRYAEGQYTQEEADAVALLSHDCGIAVDMRYASESSGARSIYQPLALANYFGYDRTVQMYFRDFYSLAEITLMLKKELAAGRPVLVSGYNKNGGHAFVLDGYDERDWFHARWGNPDGEGDGWTYLPYLAADMPKWTEVDRPEGGMNLLQMFTIGIMPDNHAEAVGIERHNFAFQYVAAVTDSVKPSPVYPRDQVELTVHDLSNVGWNALSDSVALMLKRDDGIVCPLYVYDHDFLLEEIEDTTYTDTLSIAFPKELEEGAYTIVPMYRDNALEGGKEWREALTSTGAPNYLIARVSEGTVTLQSDTASTAYLTLEDVDMPDLFINGTAPDYSVTFKNHHTEMAGRFYLLLESLDEGGLSFYLHSQGVTMMKDEVSTRRFYKTNVYAPQLGQFRLHVFYEANLFADELIELELPEEKIVTILSAEGIQITGR